MLCHTCDDKDDDTDDDDDGDADPAGAQPSSALQLLGE
jgi:hypothetical protein